MFLSPRLLACLCLLAAAAPLASAALPEHIAVHRFFRGATSGRGTAKVSTAFARPFRATRGAAGAAPDLPMVSASTGPAAPAPPASVGPPLLLGACNVLLYTVPVQFPDATSTSFNLALDTGSADLFVVSDECDDTCIGDPNQFPTSSAPGNQNTLDNLGYGSGQVDGVLFTANVSLGPSLPIALYPHILALQDTDTGLIQPFSCFVDVSPTTYIIDGLIGASPGAISRLGTGAAAGSVVDFLAQQGVPKVITTLLCDLGGYLYVGGFDPSTVTQTPSFTPLLTKNFPTYADYIVNVTGVTFGGQDVGVDSTSAPWIVDTGTNGLYLANPSGALATLDQAFFELFGVTSFFSTADAAATAGTYEFSCFLPNVARSAIDAAMPTMEFTLPAVGGGTFMISYPATYSYLQLQFASDGSFFMCPILFTGPNTIDEPPGAINVIPANLMNNLEIIFDQVNQQIGFAVPDPTICASLFVEELPPASPSPPPASAPPPMASPPPVMIAANAQPPPPSAMRVASQQPPPPTGEVTTMPPPPAVTMASMQPPPPAVTAAPVTPTTGPVASPTPGSVASPTPTPGPAPTPTPHPASHPTPHAKPHRPKPPPPKRHKKHPKPPPPKRHKKHPKPPPPRRHKKHQKPPPPRRHKKPHRKVRLGCIRLRSRARPFRCFPALGPPAAR